MKKKQYKIGVIVSRVDYGAAELLETRLALELNSLGYKVTLIPQYSDQKFDDQKIRQELKSKVRVLPLCFDKPFQFLQNLFGVRRLKLDVVISHNRGGDLLGSIISFGTRTKEIKALHEYYEEDQINSTINRVWKKILRRAAHTYHITDHVLKQNRRTFELDIQKSSVVNNAIDFIPISEEFDTENYGLPKNKKIVLTIARVVKNKGYLNNLEIMIPILKKRDDVIYVFAGDNTTDPELFKSLINRIEQSDVEEKIFYLGKINNVLGLMKKSHVLLHFANHEGFGLIFLEALHAELSIVTTNVGGIPNVLKDTEFKPFSIHDIEGARKKCLELLNSKKESIFTGDYINYLKSYTHMSRAQQVDEIIKNVV